MAGGINLLPQDIKPKVSILKLSKKLKRFILFGFMFFVFLASTVVGTLFILSNNLKRSIARQVAAKTEIKNLEATEQKLFLIRDRLDKIKQITAVKTAQDQINILEDALNQTKAIDGVDFSGAELQQTVAKVSINAGSSIALSNFLYNLYGNEDYKRINLLALKYNVDLGYTVTLSIVE
jgi:hypothetical protein